MSGRRSDRACTDDMRTLDVRRLARAGVLVPGRAFSWRWTVGGEERATINCRAEADHVVLDYRSRTRGGEWEPLRYPVRLDWTACNYGGQRAWWLCPATGCGRRVAVLFGGRVFACRHCYRLAYACQREADDDRAFRRADALRSRLGWEPGIARGSGPKPKGMHWRTFWRLRAQHDAHANAAMAMTMQRLEKLETGGGGQ